ncbi:MAG: ROK family protein [Bacteroidales bacterium]
MTETKKQGSLIGIDLGGTKVAAGLVRNGKVVRRKKESIDPEAKTAGETVEVIAGLLSALAEDDLRGIGIGIPGLVDRERGIAYDVHHVPHWNEVHVRKELETRFPVEIRVDNDANCFAMGEYRYGAWAGTRDFVGATLGTGMGSGIIKDGALLSDAHSCSGEFGLIPYLDGVTEDYSGGCFFTRTYGKSGEDLAAEAIRGETEALRAFAEYGTHLGWAIRAIMVAVDPALVILGGSIAGSFDLFRESMWKTIRDLPFPHVLKDFRVEASRTPDIALLGAAALCTPSV